MWDTVLTFSVVFMFLVPPDFLVILTVKFLRNGLRRIGTPAKLSVCDVRHYEKDTRSIFTSECSHFV